MKYTQIRRGACAAAIVSLTALAGASTSEAAMVTWNGATDIAGDSDVSTNGTLVMAYNFGDPNVASTTVNGVTFAPFALLTNDSSVKTYTVGNATLSTMDDRGPRGATTSSYQALSTAYLGLLTTTAELIADRDYTLTLSGLMVGQEYKFQIWSNDSDRGSDFPNFYPTRVDDGQGNSVSLYPGDNGTDGAGPGMNTAPTPGQFVIGTFTADATLQEFFLGGSELSGIVNGFQLRAPAPIQPPLVTAVPEPGSALVGMLVLGLCGARFGRRQRA